MPTSPSTSAPVLMRWMPAVLLLAATPLLLSAPHAIAFVACAALAAMLTAVVEHRRRDEVGVGSAAAVTAVRSDAALAPELAWPLAVASDAIVVTDRRGTIL